MKKILIVFVLFIVAWVFLCNKFTTVNNLTAKAYNYCIYNNIQPRLENTWFDGIISEWRPSYEEKSINSKDIPIKINDTYYSINASINGANIEFVLDTGCSNALVISTVEYEFLKRNGYINESDLFDTNYTAIIADGSECKMYGFITKEVKIGNYTLNNIECYVGNSPNYGRLLGKDLLDKLGNSYTIDKNKSVLVIN